MHPVHDTKATQPTAIDSREFTRALAAAMVAIALTGIILAALAFLTARPATSIDGSAVSTTEVRDGWSSYLGAAARPASQPVRDGWSSYLLAPATDSTTVRDGWSSYLLVPEIDPTTVVDGWMIRYGQDD